MTVEMTDAKLERLITAVRGGAVGAAAVVEPMGPCDPGKDKLKRPRGGPTGGRTPRTR